MLKYIPTLLLAACLSTESLAEISPYISTKYAYTHIRNDAYNDVNIKINGSSVTNTLVNKELSDNQSGFRFAAGATIPAEVIHGDIRVEAEFAYNMNAKNDGNSNFKFHQGGGIGAPVTFKNTLRSNALFLNTYYDMETGTKFKPYVGAGIGQSRLRNKAYLVNDNVGGMDKEKSFAWNLSAGIGYSITQNITMDLGYRFTNYGEIKRSSAEEIQGVPNSLMSSRSKYDISSHELSLGLRYNF